MRPLLHIENLRVYYPIAQPLFAPRQFLHAVDGISLSIYEGETLGLVGESGCGKTTLGRALLGLVPITSGKIFFAGEELTTYSSRARCGRRSDIQMVFQDTYGSLDPLMTAEQILAEPLNIHHLCKTREERSAKIKHLLISVGLDPSLSKRYPHEFSGGQRQRLGIARALSLKPRLLVCDEPVSALDVSIQAQIINLLKDLKEKYNLTIIFISHDLRVIKYLSDRVAVMYLGEIVELAPSKELFSNPKHPYTKALLNAIPSFEKKKIAEDLLLKGDLPSVTNLPKGCLFHTRCPQVMEICRTNHPILEGKDCVRCWLYNRLTD